LKRTKAHSAFAISPSPMKHTAPTMTIVQREYVSSGKGVPEVDTLVHSLCLKVPSTIIKAPL
jgi:hypothetical protein